MTDMEISGEHDVRDLRDAPENDAPWWLLPNLPSWAEVILALLIAAGLVLGSLYTAAYIGLHILFGNW
jgi:hypothetical protein